MKTTVMFILFLMNFLTSAQAGLIDRGNGMIYDTELDITWIQDATLSDLIGSYDQAVAWADQLVYGGYDDWRLSETPGTIQGWNDESEIGSLYYSTLGNSQQLLAEFVTTGPFNLSSYYVTWINGPQLPDLSEWSFQFKSSYSGFQNAWSAANLAYAWAVRDGDVSSVPEPDTFWMLITCLIGLGYTVRNINPKVQTNLIC